MDSENLSVVILTYNEEVNIRQCITSVMDWTSSIYVLDSGSTDKTVKIAESLNAKVCYRKFDNYANQRTYAIKELPINTEWILFLDADEYVTDELKKEIDQVLLNTDCNGFYIKFRLYFMDRWIKHGSIYPTWIMRLFRRDKAVLSRDINEHILIDGKVGYLKNDFIHKDNKGINEWITKHIKYAGAEALELMKNRSVKNGNDEFGKITGSLAQRRRWIRENIWDHYVPLLWRASFYFFYRYFIRLGFLDGTPGLIFHFLHGFWYPFLIDVKYLEMKRVKDIK